MRWKLFSTMNSGMITSTNGNIWLTRIQPVAALLTGER
jgi:hypothetical protein